jgi:CDGSH-type Zn-finger protein
LGAILTWGPIKAKRYLNISVDLQKIDMTKIIVNNNGSLKVEGDFEILDAQGNAYGLQGRTVLSLCRCGLSNNKPVCDGSHKEKFQDEAKAFELPPRKV